MKKNTYIVMGNRTAADVVAGNDTELAITDGLAHARSLMVAYQRNGWIAAWIVIQ